MRHDAPSDELHETAALYSLGALPAAEARALEEHLRQGCTVCEREVRVFQDLAAVVAELGGVRSARPDLRRRLLDRIAAETSRPGSARGPGQVQAPTQVWKQWQAPETLDEWLLVRRTEGEWEETGYAGVRVRRLLVDKARDQVTMLVRLDPGSQYPPHRHAGPEECYVLDGDLHVADMVMRAGDYQRVARGSIHGVQRTESGCTLFVVSSLHDEVLA